MALQFNQVEDDGVTATYFRVQQVAVYPDSQVADVVLHGWVSEAIYAAGDDPLDEATSQPTRLTYTQLGITVTDPNNPPMPTITQVYAAVQVLYPGSTIV